MPRATLSLFEIPARDPERLAGFFLAVFGWPSVAVPWQGPRYLRLLPPEAEEPTGGGILQSGQGPQLGAAQPELIDRLTVMIRIDGEPLEAVLARVELAGGAVALVPTTIADSGRFARFFDPEGNSFGLWSSLAEPELRRPAWS